ncbi:MAG: formylglycine-generating enzyme family protein [Deltaproteobacteria bacterium]|nr:formylglycine-generating enzyme family protein [Deltaproteobacteria bacterium]
MRGPYIPFLGSTRLVATLVVLAGPFSTGCVRGGFALLAPADVDAPAGPGDGGPPYLHDGTTGGWDGAFPAFPGDGLTPDDARGNADGAARDAPGPGRDLTRSLDGRPAFPADARVPDTTRRDAALADAPPPVGGPCVHPTVVERCTAGWCTIPAGCFRMGSPVTEPCRDATDETQHEVRLTRAFEVAAAEVTQGEFNTRLGYLPTGLKTGCGTSCAIELVGSHEAMAYCNALSASAGLARCYSCSGTRGSTACTAAPGYAGSDLYRCPGYRLPTDAEWEYAARAGSSSAFYNGSITNCGPRADPGAELIGWYARNSSNSVHPVQQKAKNAWGLYDMSGNLAEWVQDLYAADLGGAARIDPVSAVAVGDRVVRGGSYFSPAEELRSASRFHLPAQTTPAYATVGFRCARTLP